MILEVQCPRCKNTMKYERTGDELKSKKCVYCGYTFKVNRDRIIGRSSPSKQLSNPFKTQQL